MKWRQPADRNVVEAVLAVLCEPATQAAHDNLARLSLRQWQKSYYWLDAAGLALYLLARIEALRITETLPAPVLARFRENLIDSRQRVLSMLAEFTALNTLFTDASILYSNLKGFTLSPHSCSAPELRCQLDFDFLVDGADLELCRNLLEARGYFLRGEGPNVFEFKSHCDTFADIADIYRPKKQHSVEIHFSCDEAGLPIRDSRLDRLHTLAVNGLYIPALSSVDQFVGQANHLFGHLCGASTRVAWLLEFNNNMRSHARDETFWNQVRDAARLNPKSALALSVCILLASKVFTSDVPLALSQGMPARIPGDVASWVSIYGRRALLADTPGTKLGLLLQNELHRSDPHWGKRRRAALFPRRRAPRLLLTNPQDSLNKRLRSDLLQLRYSLFRLRFHLVEGARYLYENYRWSRIRTQNAKLPQLDYTLTKSRP